MASAGFTKGKKNFIRSYRLLVDIGTPVLRELTMMHVHLQGYNTIDDFLKHNSNTIRKCLQNKTLQRFQYDYLYPAGEGPVDIETWDISLLCWLLRVCCKLSPAEKQATETIRSTRNTMFGHNPETSLDDTTFQSVWTDLQREILTILNHIGKIDLTNETQKKIYEIKEKRIDGDEETLETIRHQVERLISITENSNTEKELQDDCSSFQRHLVTVYSEYSNMVRVPICPLESQEGVPVDKIYVEEQLTDVTPKVTGSRQSISASRNVHSFGQLFKPSDEDTSSRHVVLLGSAGRGKTTFCLRMVSVWCSAVQKTLKSETELTVPENDLITRFQLLYFISLRNAAEKEETVIEMISSQIFTENEALIRNVQKCFQHMPEKCLVIIDGIDEWSHSLKLPKRNDLNFCTTLWTTRYSKLQYILSVFSDIRILEINSFNDENIRSLVRNVLTWYYRLPTESVNKQVKHFMEDLRKRGMQLVAEVPLVLTYLVCLWREQHGLEDSRTVNFCGVLNHLLKRIKTTANKSNQTKASLPKLPGALKFYEHVTKHDQLLRSLCPFAFDCCLHNRNVFEAEVVEKLIGQDILYNCLTSGLFSQAQIPQHIHRSHVKIQFFHGTLQELLAALWICFEESGGNKVLNSFLSSCNTTEKIIEMSLILTFVCGLDPKKAGIVSQHVAKTALNEEGFKQYRQTLEGRYSFRRPSDASLYYRKVKRIQEVMLECRREMTLNNRYCGEIDAKILTRFGSVFESRDTGNVFTLHDIVITDTLDDDVLNVLQENSKDLRSVYVDLPMSERSERLEDAICKTCQLERLHLDHRNSSVIFKLSSSQMYRLHSLCLWLSNIPALPESIINLQNISGLCLYISGNHKMVEQLETFLRSSRSLKELELESVICEDHRREPRRCRYMIDVSKANNLKRLRLENVYSVCTIMPYLVQLEDVWISGAASNPSSCLCRLPESRLLSSLVLGHLKPIGWLQADYLAVADTLPKLLQLEYVYLIGINFQRYGIYPTLFIQRKLKFISLESTKLSKPGWIKLLLSILGTDDDCKAEVHIVSTNLHRYPDVWSRVRAAAMPENVTRIVLDLKQKACREKLLALNAIKLSSSVRALQFHERELK